MSFILIHIIMNEGFSDNISLNINIPKCVVK